MAHEGKLRVWISGPTAGENLKEKWPPTNPLDDPVKVFVTLLEQGWCIPMGMPACLAKKLCYGDLDVRKWLRYAASIITSCDVIIRCVGKSVIADAECELARVANLPILYGRKGFLELYDLCHKRRDT